MIPPENGEKKTKSPDDTFRSVKRMCDNNREKYLRLSSSVRTHYFNYLKKMLKENFKVYNEKYKFITDFQYEDNDNFFTEITKEIEQTAIRASMIMEPYRFEMLKMISEINCNTNNFQLYFNFSKFEKLCQLKPFQNRNSNSNSNKNDNEKYYTVDNKNSSDNQGEFNSICKEMEKLFDDNHSLTNSQCLNQNVSNENDNYNDNDNDNQNNNNISDVSQPELNNVEFSQQFIREMENDQNNDGFWNNEMVMQMSVFKRTLRKLKLKSKQSPSCNTYTNVVKEIFEIFGSMDDYDDDDDGDDINIDIE